MLGYDPIQACTLFDRVLGPIWVFALLALRLCRALGVLSKTCLSSASCGKYSIAILVVFSELFFVVLIVFGLFFRCWRGLRASLHMLTKERKFAELFSNLLNRLSSFTEDLQAHHCASDTHVTTLVFAEIWG